VDEEVQQPEADDEKIGNDEDLPSWVDNLHQEDISHVLKAYDVLSQR
jgi:hypothetical protein